MSFRLAFLVLFLNVALLLALECNVDSSYKSCTGSTCPTIQDCVESFKPPQGQRLDIILQSDLNVNNLINLGAYDISIVGNKKVIHLNSNGFLSSSSNLNIANLNISGVNQKNPVFQLNSPDKARISFSHVFFDTLTSSHSIFAVDAGELTANFNWVDGIHCAVSSSVFDISTRKSSNVVLEDVYFRNSKFSGKNLLHVSADNEGIQSANKIGISRFAFVNCTVDQQNMIYLQYYVAEIQHCTFKPRNALQRSLIFHEGSLVTIRKCVFSHGHSIDHGGFIYSLFSTLNIYDSTFFNSSASFFGGAIFANSSVVSLFKSRFDDCSSPLAGGAIHLHSCTFRATDSTFGTCSNTAPVGDSKYSGYFCATCVKEADNQYQNFSGGAIYAFKSDATLTSVNFHDCKSTHSGGAYAAFDGSAMHQLHLVTARNCYADGVGGGLYFDVNNVNASHCSVSNCVSKSFGGGVGIRELNATFDFLTISNCASLNDGAGGFHSHDDVTLVIRRSNIKNCVAKRHGGAISVCSTNLTFEDCSIENSVSHNVGGALMMDHASNVFISRCNFTDSSSTGDGGHVYLHAHSTLNVFNSLFAGSRSGHNGGVIYSNMSNILLDSSSFANSSAKNDGGCLFFYRSIVNVRTSEFRSFNSGSSGGAIYSRYSILNIDGSILANNTAGSFGGAIAMSYATNSSIQNTRFINSTSNTGGGSIHFYHGCNVSMVNAVISNSSSVNGDGGAICCSGRSTLNLRGSSIGRSISRNGNFIYSVDSTITVDGSNFIRCNAEDVNVKTPSPFLKDSNIRTCAIAGGLVNCNRNSISSFSGPSPSNVNFDNTIASMFHIIRSILDFEGISFEGVESVNPRFSVVVLDDSRMTVNNLTCHSWMTPTFINSSNSKVTFDFANIDLHSDLPRDFSPSSEMVFLRSNGLLHLDGTQSNFSFVGTARNHTLLQFSGLVPKGGHLSFNLVINDYADQISLISSGSSLDTSFFSVRSFSGFIPTVSSIFYNKLGESTHNYLFGVQEKVINPVYSIMRPVVMDSLNVDTGSTIRVGNISSFLRNNATVFTLGDLTLNGNILLTVCGKVMYTVRKMELQNGEGLSLIKYSGKPFTIDTSRISAVTKGRGVFKSVMYNVLTKNSGIVVEFMGIRDTTWVLWFIMSTMVVILVAGLGFVYYRKRSRKRRIRI